MKKKILFIILLLIVFVPVFSVSAATSKVDCGNITDIPKKIPELTSYAMRLVQIAVPIIFVIVGSLDLFKGLTSQKEDEIKKGQQAFVKRLIIAILIFFIVVIVKLVISVVELAVNGKLESMVKVRVSLQILLLFQREKTRQNLYLSLHSVRMQKSYINM